MGFLFVAYAAAIDGNQQWMRWELAEAGGLWVWRPHQGRVPMRASGRKTGVSPALSFFCQRFVTAHAASHLPETHLQLSMNIGPVPSPSWEVLRGPSYEMKPRVGFLHIQPASRLELWAP